MDSIMAQIKLSYPLKRVAKN